MNAKPSIGRFRYQRLARPLAWAVVLVIGSALAYGQFLRVEKHFKTPPPSYSAGWPYPYAWKAAPSEPLDYVRWRSLAGDIGWWFVMITPVLITAGRLVYCRRFSPSVQTLVSVSAAAGYLLMCTDRLSDVRTINVNEPSLAAFQLALLGVSFCWLQLVALGVTSSFATIWHRSAHLLTRVASYAFIGMVVVGLDLWLYSHGFLRSDEDLWEWLDWTLFFGAGVTLLFGAIVWLCASVKGIVDNYGRRLDSMSNR